MLVIGAGRAGLAVGWHLRERGIRSFLLIDSVAHERGVTGVPGLSIVGLPWLRTRGSALLGFVQDDAAWLSAHVSQPANATRPAAPVALVDGPLM